MAKFHNLQIKDIKKETSDCVSIAFDVPDSLKENFKYKQGQYLTIRLMINGEDLRRSYSICSSPANGEALRIAVKKVSQGKASGYLNDMVKPGQQLEVMEPMGNFYTEMDPSHQKHYVAFAAGSGITPVFSIVKTILLSEPLSKVTLFYGNRSFDSIIFKEELGRLSEEYDERLKVYHILSRNGKPDNFYYGRIDADKCHQIITDFKGIKDADEFFLCGPFEMIQTVEESLKKFGVSKERIHFELFTTEVPANAAIESRRETPGSGEVVTSEITVVLDGEETLVKVPDGTTILDAVLDAGLDAPYACTGGSCCTCRAKVLEGSAEMEVNYALTDKEVAQGYILTCQSHPTSETMIVDYDAP